MAEEIDVENERNSNFEGLVILTLTFDPAIPHTVVHHSSTCSYMPNFMEMGRKKFRKSTLTLTLTFDRAIRHIALHQSSTSTYIPNFIQIEETFCGRTDVRTYGWTDISPLYIIRSTLGSRPNKKTIYEVL